MKNITKLLLTIFAITMLFVLSSINEAHASQISLPSANLAGSQAVSSLPTAEQDNRAEILKSYLEQYNSPLADHADTLIKEADANQLDWKMVAAIAGVESGFGEAIPAYSYNAWGFGVYGTNVRRFD